MNKERLKESWQNYIDDLFRYSVSKPPFLFETPYCATCAHWYLLGEDELEALSIYSPVEYESICRGIQGKISKAYKEEGEVKDVYTDHLFHGFCKRYPPSLVDTNSTIRFRLIFSFMNAGKPGKAWGQSYIIHFTKLIKRGKVWAWHGSCGSNTRKNAII